MALWRRVQLLLRIVVGGIFLYAGVVKAMDPNLFFKDIQSFQLLPRAADAALALYLPWLEIFCGLALVTQRAVRAAACLVLLMLLAFLVALIAAWARGLDITCGCFGPSVNHSQYGWWITRDLLLIAATLLGMPPITLSPLTARKSTA